MQRAKICRGIDERQYEGAILATAVSSKTFLGNPEVVGGLIADFCMLVREMLMKRSNGEVSAEEFVKEVNLMRDRMAGIFAGRDRQYTSIKGWPQELDSGLRVALGSYWESHRDKNDNHPFKAFFSWLCWAVFDSLKRSKLIPTWSRFIW